MGVLILNVLNPAGAAGGEHGQLCSGLELFHELGRFLHDGEVGGQGGVEHIVSAEHLECGDDLAHDRNVSGDAELLTYADADRGSDLNCDLLGGVENGLPHFADLVFDYYGAGGTYRGALAAAHALGIGELVVKAAGDIGLNAAVSKIYRMDVLYLGAHPDALAAENALGGIADDCGRGVVNGQLAVIVCEADIGDIVALCVFLKLALT